MPGARPSLAGECGLGTDLPCTARSIVIPLACFGHVQWSDPLRAGHAVPAVDGILAHCGSLRWRPSRTQPELRPAVPRHGVCPTHEAQEPALLGCLLGAVPTDLYHAGFTARIHVSTLARANRGRSWRIHADLAQRLIARARTLYAGEDLGLELDETVYALDSSTVDLCLSVFPWATFRATKAAVKLHTLLDLRGSIPSFIHISDGKLHDVNVLDLLIPEAGAIYVMDRAYVDFERLYQLHQAGASFVTRTKKKLKYHRVYSAPKDREGGILADQTIALDGRKTKKAYPLHLRRICYRVPESGKRLVFLTNRTDLDAATVCHLYKSRWQVELFFRWMKQNLQIQRFFGTSENAVKSQVWIAVAVYALVAIIRKELGTSMSLYDMLEILSSGRSSKCL